MRTNPARPSIVGRDAELAAAAEAIAQARNAQGSIVVVRGPAGIGKSRFLEAVRSLARAEGAQTAAAANYSAVRAPFGPFVDAIAELRAENPDVVPAQAGERALFERCFGAGTADVDATIDRRRVFVVLANALVRAARRLPLFLAVDDAHWADPESLEFLQYWARQAGRSRVVTFVASRNVGDEAGAADVTLALERFEHVRTIELAPLDERAARELIAFRLPAGRTLPGRTTDEICRLAEGNPLFAQELLAATLASDGQPRLPRSIEQTVRQRLRSLDPRHTATLEAAAALGRSFALDDLAAAADIDAAGALRALREAREAGLLDEDAATPGRFVFQHELIRLAIYETMFSAERAVVHRRIAETLEAKDAAPEILADHWRRAGNLTAAVDYAERAGDAAAALGAFGSARNRYLDVLDGTAGAVRARLCEKLAIALDALGDSLNARRYIQEALDFHRGQAAAAKIAELECRHADVAYRCGDVEAAIAAATRVLDAPDAAPEHRFTARVALATYSAFRADIAATLEHIALADAQLDGRTPVQEVCLEWARATVAMETSPSELWRESTERCLQIAEAHTRPVIVTLTTINVAIMARECGRSDHSRPALARAIALADENGLVLAGAYARTEAIEDLYARGRLREAHALIRDTVALQVDAPLMRIALAGSGLPILLDLGVADEFPMIADRALLETAFEMGEASRYAPLAASFARIDADAGRLDAARELIERALRDITSVRYVAAALLGLAQLGDAAHVEKIDALFSQAMDRRGNRAYRLLVAALRARSADDADGFREAAARARQAALDEERQLLYAYALELEGKRAEALAVYQACDAVVHVRRLAPRRGALSKRESEIAGLLREGLSNRAIAQRLVLSERTVENHVASICAKSGVRTRAEFTARASA